MSDASFEEIVLQSVRDADTKNLDREAEIEAEIRQRMDDAITKLEKDFNRSRYTMLTEAVKTLTNDKQLAFYLIRLLAADNIYDIKSFVAYGIGSMLERLKSKATGGAENMPASRKRTPACKTQSRATGKFSSRSVNSSRTPSSTDSSQQESNSKNSPRRSSRLARQHSQRHGIRKTYTKPR
jgi:hypothetical protein